MITSSMQGSDIYKKGSCANVLLTLNGVKQRLTVASRARYSFELTAYSNQKQKIKCRCGKCLNEWCSTIGKLLRGSGCPRCAIKQKADTKRTPIHEVHQRLMDASDGRYSFELTTYENQRQRIKCKCNTCGYEWLGQISGLIGKFKRGCPNCAIKLRADKKHIALNDAIQNLDNVSRGRYTYELTEYKGCHQRIKCKCNSCGYEWKTTYMALTGRKQSGCKMCATRSKSLKYMLAPNVVNTRLNEVSQGRYKFQCVAIFTGIKQKIHCECAKCNYKWSTSYSNLIRGTGCPKCAGKARTKDEAITMIKGLTSGKFEVEIDNYVGSRSKVRCKCKTCGGMWQREFSQFCRNRGCPKCNRLKYNTEEARKVLTMVSANRYTFVLDSYQHSHQKVMCRCNKCGYEWSTIFASLVRTRSACIYCVPHTSKPECEIVDYIKQNFPQLEVQQSARNLIKNVNQNHFMELDIYIPSLSLAIEFNGSYWHSDKMIQKRSRGVFLTAQAYHDYKSKQCNQKGIKLIHINEQDYIMSKQVIFTFLSGVLNGDKSLT